MHLFPFELYTPNAGVFIPMVFVLMTPDFDARTAFLDPPRALATIHVHQTLDIPYTIALRNNA